MNYIKKLFGFKVNEIRFYRISREVIGDDFSGFGSYSFSYYDDPETPIDFQKICDIYYKHFFTLVPSENATEIITKKGAPVISEEEEFQRESSFADFQYKIKLIISLKDNSASVGGDSSESDDSDQYVPYYHIIYYSKIKGNYSTNTIMSIVQALDEIQSMPELGHHK